MSRVYQREGVLLDSGVLASGDRILYSVWLIYEVKEIKVPLNGSIPLNVGDWVRIKHTDDDYDYSLATFQKIPPVLPTKVVNGAVRIKTTVVFDTRAKVKYINDRGDFLATARYFGRVEAYAKLDDLVPDVAYDGVSVERITKHEAGISEKWFIAQQSLRHPSKEHHSLADEHIGPFEGVVVSVHRFSTFIWNPLLGEGILRSDYMLKKGDWVKFFIFSSSLHKRHNNPNIHFVVAKCQMIKAILRCQPCRNTLEMETTVNFGDCAVNSTKTGIIFADWIGPVLDRRNILYKLVTSAPSTTQRNRIITVVVVREKKTLEEPIAVWTIINAEFILDSVKKPITTATNVNGGLGFVNDNMTGDFGRGTKAKVRGIHSDTTPTADDNSYQEWHSGEQIMGDEDRLSRCSSVATLKDVVTASRIGFNAPTGLQPSSGYSASSLNRNGEEDKEGHLTRSLRLLGQLFKNSEIRNTIKEELPTDYGLLYRYYGVSPSLSS